MNGEAARTAEMTGEAARTAEMTGPARAALELANVSVHFGGRIALSQVTLSAAAGAVTGLVGPNGAGKSTLFNVASGMLRPTSGEVWLAGREVSRWRPAERARAGLARTFQHLELFAMLSVRENVQVAVEALPRAGGGGSRQRETEARVDELLTRCGLGPVASERVTTLPTGTARMVEVARALAGAPKVLLLDEPAAGQTDAESARFAVLVRELAASGMAVVLVEHDTRLVRDVCDVIYVLDLGFLLTVGPPTQVFEDSRVREAYLGPERGGPGRAVTLGAPA